MTTTALVVQKRQAEASIRARQFDTLDKLIDGGSKIGMLAISSPLFQAVLTIAAIKTLERVKFDSGEYAWQDQPGTHAKYYGPVKTPLLTVAQGDFFLGMLVTAEALKASSSGLAGLLSGLLGFLQPKA